MKEEVPPNAPPAYGKPVEVNAWVDADHACDCLTRRSHTGIIIFLNSAPTLWYTKRQATIESSTFGLEAVALRTLLQLIKALRYKLRMMGVPLTGPGLSLVITRASSTEPLFPKISSIRSTLVFATMPSARRRRLGSGRSDLRKELKILPIALPRF